MEQQSPKKLLGQLIDLLDRAVREQVGENLSETMFRVQRVAQERRSGLPEAESRLTRELAGLSVEDLRALIRWLSMYFDLLNLVEDRQRIGVLQARTERARLQGKPRSESIAAAIHNLKEQGLSPSEVQRWLDRLKIEPVFTAHPSEAKRRTTRQLLRQIRSKLIELEHSDSRQTEQGLLADLTVFWQTDLVRPERPPVMSEVSRGLFFAATLWDVVPRVYRDLRTALKEVWPQHQFQISPIISFGSWIGGDRDGHPFVTVDITRRTLSRLRRAAVENHLVRCRDMLSRLVMSNQQIDCEPALLTIIDDATERWETLRQRLEPMSRFEACRRFLKVVEYRLEQTLAAEVAVEQDMAGFQSAEEFREYLSILSRSITANRGRVIAEEVLQPWIDLVDTFGFHFAKLDIRQNSNLHQKCISEICEQLDLPKKSSDQDRIDAALDTYQLPEAVDLERLSPEAREVFQTFQLLAEEVSRWGTGPLGGYVISMTHSARDVRIVHWLWGAAWNLLRPGDPLPHLPIAPLFETIDDLQNAPRIMGELFSDERYFQYLSQDGTPRQMAMVGYSDSTKDGGYLSACWELHQAQEELARIAGQLHVELTIFHGRGGALGRGGGPAARAIRSLPSAAVRGRLRVTEQGEVLAERYDDPQIAYRHLEQLVNATLLVSAQPAPDPDPSWIDAMTKMAERSFRHYRQLVQHPGFIDYFNLATPINEIESLPIGSRPARRGERKSLGDLRAIPWTFAWTQSRHILPAWFGLGTGVREFVDEHDPDWSRLRSMYNDWPMFRALIDNAELALAKADMGIAHNYAALVQTTEGEEIWKMISDEFERSRGGVLMITSQNSLMEQTDWLGRSIQDRNPYVDPLNFAQIVLLERRLDDDQNPEILDLIRLTIQGVASGLRTTG